MIQYYRNALLPQLVDDQVILVAVDSDLLDNEALCADVAIVVALFFLFTNKPYTFVSDIKHRH